MEEKGTPDWSKFTVKQPFKSEVEEIKKAWLSQEALEKWFLKLAEFTTPNGDKRKRTEQIRPGDSYRWQWYGWPESVEEKGEILKPEKDEFVRFKFGKAGIVGVHILEAHGETILSLQQENIPLNEESKMNFYVGCKTGWTFYMLNLKSILQNGPDLRNKHSELQMD